MQVWKRTYPDGTSQTIAVHDVDGFVTVSVDALASILEAAGLVREPIPVHRAPGNGSATTPCCGLTPFELPAHERLSNDPEQVTCTALEEAGRRLASEREDIVAAGVDPAELLVPLAPVDLSGRRTYSCEECQFYIVDDSDDDAGFADDVAAHEEQHLDADPEECSACDTPLDACSRDAACCSDCTHMSNWPPAAVLPKCRLCGEESCAPVHMTKDGHEFNG